MIPRRALPGESGRRRREIAEQVVFVVTGLFREMADIGASAESARG